MPEQFVFRDLRDLLAKANEEKSGDQLAGLGRTTPSLLLLLTSPAAPASR